MFIKLTLLYQQYVYKQDTETIILRLLYSKENPDCYIKNLNWQASLQ